MSRPFKHTQVKPKHGAAKAKTDPNRESDRASVRQFLEQQVRLYGLEEQALDETERGLRSRARRLGMLLGLGRVRNINLPPTKWA